MDLPAPRHDWALFFDIDGTLIDLAPTPDAVVVPADLRTDLETLLRHLGAIALVSGRPLTGIDALFAPLVLPASGQHGAEARMGGEYEAAPPLPTLRAIVMPLQQFAADHHGILIEDKGDSVAVHYRMAPTLAEDVDALAHRLIDGAPELEALTAKMAIDIKPKAISKANAIRWFLARPPFAGRIPVFVGDDRTDEPGFAAVNEVGGHSIRVGDLAESSARFSLNSSAAVREWIAGLVRFYEQGGGSLY